MRHPSVIVASVLAIAALALAPAATAQCNEHLKVGNTFDWSVASDDKTITGKGSLKVEKNDGSYIEFAVTSGTSTGIMPGGIDGGRVIATNPKNGNVWSISCTMKGLEGTSTLAGKAMKFTATKRK